MAAAAHITYCSAVVVIPPQRLWQPIQAIRSRHDRHLRRWMPHITLLYPFYPRSEFPFWAERLGELCLTQAPIGIRLEALQYFHQGRGRYTLWLAPQPAQALIDLQHRLQRIATDCDEQSRFAGGFIPHLSLGQVREKAGLARLLESLGRSWQPVDFKIDELYMIWRKEPPEDVFQVAHRLRLGG